MNRVELVDYVAADLAKLFTAVGLVPADDYSGIKEPIDNAFADLGLDPSLDTLDGPFARVGRALARYYALIKIRQAASFDFVDTGLSGPGSTRSDNQVLAHLDTLIAEASKACTALGYPVSEVDSFVMGTLFLDFLEGGDENQWPHQVRNLPL